MVSLWLKPEYAEQWIREGVSTVRFQRSGAVLQIELAAITPDWFALDSEVDEISSFVFTLDPGPDGVRVEVNAFTDNLEAQAAALSGITLILDEAEIDVTENGRFTR